MNQLSVYRVLVYFLLVVVISSCTKKPLEDEQPFAPCQLYTEVSSDTNYIPHKKNNYWRYCLGGWSGWDAKIILDTVIGNKLYFVRTFQFTPGHSGGGAGNSMMGDRSNYSVIDASGKYYFLKSRFVNSLMPQDTVLIINPSAANGDTIYNSSIANVKVVLVNKSETFYSVPDCYHSRVILNANSNSKKIVDHYFKKGLGEIYFTENISVERSGEMLDVAIIN